MIGEIRQSDQINTSSTRHNITLFILWFRVIAILLALLISITGIKPVSLSPFVLAIVYNTLLYIFRSPILKTLQAYPPLIVVDALVGFILLIGSGGYGSPFYLYNFSSLTIGAYLFGYPYAVLLTVAQSILFFMAVEIDGYTLSEIAATGEHIVTDFFFFLLISLSTAYLSDLLKKLDLAKERKGAAESELEEMKRNLELSLKLNQLSEREVQVFMQALDGMTIDEIAQALDISKNSVKTYLLRSYKKLGVSTKQEAILKVKNWENQLA